MDKQHIQNYESKLSLSYMVRFILIHQSREKHTCPGLLRDGFVNSFSYLFNKWLFSPYYVMDLVLGLVRARGSDNRVLECQDNNLENVYAIP